MIIYYKTEKKIGLTALFIEFLSRKIGPFVLNQKKILYKIRPKMHSTSNFLRFQKTLEIKVENKISVLPRGRLQYMKPGGVTYFFRYCNYFVHFK